MSKKYKSILLVAMLGACLLATMFLPALGVPTLKTAAAQTCEGDFDTDGDVDGSDLAIFAADFGRTNCPPGDLCYTKAEVDALVAGLQGQIDVLKGLLAGVTRNGNDITFSGVNVHIVNGTDDTETTNGTGNLIVGYNELRDDGTDDRSGSHNIVVGKKHNYSSYGGLVVALQNSITEAYTSVSGGSYNKASGQWSSVSGGSSNTASSSWSSVSGGTGNTASHENSSVSGGSSNTASGSSASVSGGRYNTASGYRASVSGGHRNTASGYYSSVSGGRYNKASGAYSFVGGGGYSDSNNGNEAFSNYSAILGGSNNIAGDNSNPDDHSVGEHATVSGGGGNYASGIGSSISGGYGNYASGPSSSISGGSYNKANGDYSYVGGGGGYDLADGNQAFSHFSAVLGGQRNIAGDNSNPDDHSVGEHATVSGGEYNTASGYSSSVSGGLDNTASGRFASVSGGAGNEASGSESSVSGGLANTASGVVASVSGGSLNEAFSNYSAILGGRENISGDNSNPDDHSIGKHATVSGGFNNTASGDYSSVSGGSNRLVFGIYDWRAGLYWQDQ